MAPVVLSAAAANTHATDAVVPVAATPTSTVATMNATCLLLPLLAQSRSLLSVILHADYVHSLLSPTTRFVAKPDGGFFMDLPTWNGKPSYTPIYQWLAAAKRHVALLHGTVHAALHHQ